MYATSEQEPRNFLARVMPASSVQSSEIDVFMNPSYLVECAQSIKDACSRESEDDLAEAVVDFNHQVDCWVAFDSGPITADTVFVGTDNDDAGNAAIARIKSDSGYAKFVFEYRRVMMGKLCQCLASHRHGLPRGLQNRVLALFYYDPVLPETASQLCSNFRQFLREGRCSAPYHGVFSRAPEDEANTTLRVICAGIAADVRKGSAAEEQAESAWTQEYT